jgi:hypothetical protein
LSQDPSGWEIRYNAVATLARRGSSDLPLNILAEMLDEDCQLRNFGVQQPDGQYLDPQGQALEEILVALQATDIWLKHYRQPLPVRNRHPQVNQIGHAVKKLTQNPNRTVANQAKVVLPFWYPTIK